MKNVFVVGVGPFNREPLGGIFPGADSRKELLARVREAERLLGVRVRPVSEAA